MEEMWLIVVYHLRCNGRKVELRSGSEAEPCQGGRCGMLHLEAQRKAAQAMTADNTRHGDEAE